MKVDRLWLTISLSSLLKLGALKVNYRELREAIERSKESDMQERTLCEGRS